MKAGSKQDPKTFKSSSNLDIKVQFNRRNSLLVRSGLLFSFVLSQVLKTGQEIGFFE